MRVYFENNAIVIEFKKSTNAKPTHCNATVIHYTNNNKITKIKIQYPNSDIISELKQATISTNKNKTGKCPFCEVTLLRLYATIYSYSRTAHRAIGWICPKCLRVSLDKDAAEKIKDMLIKEGKLI